MSGMPRGACEPKEDPASASGRFQQRRALLATSGKDTVLLDPIKDVSQMCHFVHKY